MCTYILHTYTYVKYTCVDDGVDGLPQPSPLPGPLIWFTPFNHEIYHLETSPVIFLTSLCHLFDSFMLLV